MRKFAIAFIALAIGSGWFIGRANAYTSAATPAAVTPSATGPRISIAKFMFGPSTLTVPAGTTVTWTNTDQAAHTVTADDGSFDTGFVAPGQTVSLTFAAPGTYPYYCIPHGAPGGAGMAGVIVVQ